MQDKKELSNRQETTFFHLLYYRGCTAIQLAKLAYVKKETTKSQKTSVYKQLQFLEQEKLVTRDNPHPKVSKFATYKLTKSGLDFANEKFGLEEGFKDEGWVHEDGQTDLGHFNYDVYEPPETQVQHFSSTVDILITLNLNRIKHRNNLYAKRELITGHMSSDRYMLRPDAEMEINGQIYTIEIDRGTESHAQLVNKFKNYFNYCGSLMQYKGSYDLHNIVFVVKSDDNGRLRRRWNNLLAAYYIAMQALHDRFNLYLVTEDDFENFVRIERDRDELCAQLLAKSHNSKYNCVHAIAGNMYTATLQHEETLAEIEVKYQVLSTPYSSKNLLMALEMTESKNNFLDCEHASLYLSNNLDMYSVNEEIIYLYNKARHCAAVKYL